MSISTRKYLAKANALSLSLDELESELEQLFSQSLPDTAESLDHLQRAKLHVLIPYLINDLIFIYLRTKGVDPKTHPVIAELNRVRQYFAKISDVEKSDEKKTTAIDRAAAGRFIKHAISLAIQSEKAPSTSTSTPQPAVGNRQDGEPGASSSHMSVSAPAFPSVPVRETEKMRERARYHRNLAESLERGEEEMLDVVEDALEKHVPDSDSEVGRPSHTRDAGRVDIKSMPRRRRRNAMDPFISMMNETAGTSSPPKKRRKSKSFQGKDDIDDTSHLNNSTSEDGVRHI